MPSDRLLKELQERAKTTPDLHKFRNYEHTLLFVYDEMMRGGHFHRSLSTAKYLGKAVTILDRYIVKLTAPSLPVAYKEETISVKRGYIEGEVYAVTPNELINLDVVKANRSLFLRENVNIMLHDQESPLKTKGKPMVRAWMYLGNPDIDNKDGAYGGSFFRQTRQGTKVRHYKYSTSFEDDRKKESQGSIWDYSEKYGYWRDY